MAHDWRSAYLRQAKSDYALFLMLTEANAPLCHRLHYLQMATEKMSKGLLTPPGGPRFARSHNALVNFMIVAKVRHDIREASHFKSRTQFIAYIDSLIDTGRRIEDLSPEGDDHPNPEYPWEVQGRIVVPIEYAFANLDLNSPKMIKLLQFVHDCFSAMEAEGK